MANPQQQDDGLGSSPSSLGVITGGIVRDPQSATLTTTIEGLWIRQLLSTGRAALSRIADTSKAFTASKDTYVGVTSAGALFYIENTLNDPKPTNAAVIAAGGVGAQLLAKVVTDGTRVTDGGVTDMRIKAAVQLESFVMSQSFTTADQGPAYWIAPCRIRVWKAQSTVMVDLSGTDAGTITLARGINDKYTDMTNGVVTLALSSATGVRASALPSANFILDAGQSIRLTSAKTTTVGSAITQVLYQPI